MHRKEVAVTTIALVLILGQSGPSLAQQYPHKLTSTEVRERMSDSTSYSPGNFGPKTYTTYYFSNGQIKMRSPDFRMLALIE
jgi:hypothetical protein